MEEASQLGVEVLFPNKVALFVSKENTDGVVVVEPFTQLAERGN